MENKKVTFFIFLMENKKVLINKYLAIALPSFRISPLLLIRIATIALLYTVAISIFVIYIQSIGSGIVSLEDYFILL
jgi:hypothetical protein